MRHDLGQAQLLRYAQDLQELMCQYAQLQQHHANALALLRKDRLTSEEFQALALHDPLTGLPNRRLLEQRLDDALRSVRADSGDVYLLYMDLDRFKPINDEHGHAAGDLVLQEVARRLQAAVRRDDTVARVGGDEFVVLLRHMESVAVVLSILESILNAMKVPIAAGELALSVGISIGCARYPSDGADITELLAHADTAMYRAKRAGLGYAWYSTPALAPLAKKIATHRE
jgi:diguanylate cyclase (GGDEF)-like protein